MILFLFHFSNQTIDCLLLIMIWIVILFHFYVLTFFISSFLSILILNSTLLIFDIILILFIKPKLFTIIFIQKTSTINWCTFALWFPILLKWLRSCSNPFLIKINFQLHLLFYICSEKFNYSEIWIQFSSITHSFYDIIYLNTTNSFINSIHQSINIHQNCSFIT